MAITRFYIKCSKLKPNEILNDKLTPITVYTETEIKGYMGSASDNIIKIADQDTVETRFKFYCDDFSLTIGDLIKYEGDTYEVTAQPRNTAHRNNHVKTMVRKVDNIKQH